MWTKAGENSYRAIKGAHVVIKSGVGWTAHQVDVSRERVGAERVCAGRRHSCERLEAALKRRNQVHRYRQVDERVGVGDIVLA